MIHILDYKTEKIVGTLENKENTSLFWLDTHKQSLKDNLETFDFTMQANVKESEYVSKRNRIIIQDEDGFFREFIIFEAKQYSDLTKEVYTNASYTDLKKQKIIEPTTLDNQTISNAGQFVLSDASYQLGIIDISGTRKIVFENYTDALSALQIIASAFDCELRFRVEVKGNRIIGRYVDFLQQVGDKDGKEIELGKDLIGITRKENTDEIVTALIVLGPEKEDGTRTIVTVKDEDSLQRWADKDNRHLWDVYEPQVDQDVTEERLTELGRNELNKRINSLVEYTADTASIEHIFGYEHEKVRLGDTTRIKDTSFEPALYVEARVIEVERSISDPSAKSYVLGDFIEYSEEDIMGRFKKLQAILQQKVSAGEITAIREYVDQQDQANYEDSTHYADTVSDTAKTEAIEAAATDATQKADNAKTEAINTAATDATQKANAAESNAKSYAETKAEEAKEAAIAAVKSQIETDIATAEAELKKYSDSAAEQAEIDAKKYTDNIKTQIETAMTSHADSVAADAEAAAKKHADSVGSTVETAAKQHADSQAAAAQTNAQNFAKNASNINTGTLNGTVVNITNLNASNIVSGNMSADFIYGGTINGTTVNVINLNAANIRSGTLDTARLATSSITADKLVIGDFTNLCENPDFEGDTVGSTPKGYADSALAKVLDISTYQNGNGSSKALGLNARNNGNSDIYGTNLIPVKAGQKFYVEAEARYLNTAGTGYGRIGFNRYDENKNMLSNWDSVASWGSTSKETAFTKKSGVYTVPHNGYIRLWVSFANNAETSNVFVVDNIRVHRMASSELIVDGAITADKINVSNLAAITANLGTVTAGSIDAAKVSITNLNASNINAGTLNAARIGSKAITADKINVTSLSALSANLGTVNSGTVNGVTINGSVFNSVDPNNSRNWLKIENKRSYSEGENGSVNTKRNFYTTTVDNGMISGTFGDVSATNAKLLIGRWEMGIGGMEIDQRDSGGGFVQVHPDGIYFNANMMEDWKQGIFPWGSDLVLSSSGIIDIRNPISVSQPMNPMNHSVLQLINGWISYGGNFQSGSYTKSADGFVHLRGVVKNGTSGSTIAQLPVGCRPYAVEIFTTSNINNTFGRIDVYPDGRIVHMSGQIGFVSLSGIVFRAEN